MPVYMAKSKQRFDYNTFAARAKSRLKRIMYA